MAHMLPRMFDEFIDTLNARFGWIVGTRFDCQEKGDKKIGSRRKDEVDSEYAKRYIEGKRAFNRSYWIKAYIRRVLIATLLVLLILNPGRSAFISYEKSEVHYPEGLCGREYNFFVCSLYKAGEHEYLGMLGNFFSLRQKRGEQEGDMPKLSTTDTTWRPTSIAPLWQPPSGDVVIDTTKDPYGLEAALKKKHAKNKR